MCFDEVFWIYEVRTIQVLSGEINPNKTHTQIKHNNILYRVRVEFDNNDESVQIACYVTNLSKLAIKKDKFAKYEFLFSVFLIEQSERKTNLVKGL